MLAVRRKVGEAERTVVVTRFGGDKVVVRGGQRSGTDGCQLEG